MRNVSCLLCFLLLVDGVFGDSDAVKSVSVIEGDSVTLYTDVSELQSDDKIVWLFGVHNEIIAKIQGGGNFKTFFSEERFRDRLELDSKGSLTIKNIKKEHEGLYEVEISGKNETSQRFKVTVRDKDNVSVTEGDTVTLYTGVTDKQRDDQIQWKFGDQGTLIARLNGPVDASWRNIHLNDQTGDLNIRNIQRDQTGVYKVEINTSSMILHRKVYIAVEGMMNVSVMEGESVTLRTGVIEIQGHDLILWKFEDHLIAEINKETNQFILYDSGDVRFKGRLQPNEKTGSLTISKSRTTDSGVYHLNMSSSSHTVQRTISVTVSDSGLSSGAVAGICVAVFLPLIVAALTAVVMYYRHRISKIERQINSREEGTSQRILLKDKSSNHSSTCLKSDLFV